MRSAFGPAEDRVRDRLIGGFSVAALCAVLLYRLQPRWSGWTVAALLGLALAIWHGAYDTVLARGVMRRTLGRSWRLPFYLGYVGLAVAVLALWWAFPVVALVAFLLYSAFHFGTEAEPNLVPVQTLSALAFGALPIVAACRWSRSEVEPIFVLLLRGHEAMAHAISTAAGRLLVPAIALSLLPLLRAWPSLVRRTLVLLSVLLLFRLCPPLLAFAVYFCLWHTPEHLLETSHDGHGRPSLHTMTRNLRGGMAPWLLSLAAVAIAGWTGRHTLQAYTGLIFVALSALTVPHMVLALLLHGARRPSIQGC